eukprot:TRINITY_DN1724_c1_g1_i1.p1 TRINITY_DN1724_c1_g1~~TRINITY_DN1724_c1_g1_i1.p1  ORF type:complete len:1118 (+),score=401.74 TRINITY_DN1724_c1_g1_i1:118-3471(+)
MEEQFQQIDRLCELGLGASTPAERQEATRQLQELQKFEHLAALRFVLERSVSPYTHFFAAKTLYNLVTDHWNALAEQRQHAELRTWLVSFIGTKARTLQKFVLVAVVGVLTRITKLGWLENVAFQELPRETHKFFLCSTTGIDQPIVGLLVLNSLVTEITTACPKMTLSQHRKTVVSFRDTCLLEIFKIALGALERIRAEQTTIDSRFVEQGVSLAHSCLSFDFVGIFSDDSSDDMGTLQIPTSWKGLLVDPATMTTFCDLYGVLPPPQSTDLLRCIVQFASVRRSLFADDPERSQWLSHILRGVLTVLRTKVGLDKQENYHEFCRLLSRIKPNYQLSELVNAEYYAEWLQLTADFTTASFVNWAQTSNSSFYLLSLWSRLLSAQPYLRGDKPSLLMDHAPRVVESYISSRMELARASVERPGQIENALENQGMLLVQLESLPVLARAMYNRVGPFLVSLAVPDLDMMRTCVVTIKSQGVPPGQEQEMMTRLQILDARLAWLVYMMGSITSHHTSIGSSDPQAEAQDGEVTAVVLQLAQVVTQRLTIPQQTQMETLQRLESAILYFLNGFRKVYIGETTIPCSKVYPRLKDLVGLDGSLGVLRVVIEHIISNVQAWKHCPRVINETLSLFYELSCGYSSGRLVLQLPDAKTMLQNHTDPVFSFVDVPANRKQRLRFYKTLANLLFLESSGEAAFENFMRPLQQKGFHLAQMPDAQFQQPEVKAAIIGWLLDIRGVCSSCLNKRTYALFFDWVFPFISVHNNPGASQLPLMLRFCQVFAADNDVTVPLLRFYGDFVNNKSQRISFESSSPNGILLFREASAMLKTYGQQLYQRLSVVVRYQQAAPGTPQWGAQPPVDSSTEGKYREVYKGFNLCLNILSRALNGGYCNFGVFPLYKDPALDDALQTVVQLALTAPIDDVLSYPKVGGSYYTLMEILFSAHTGWLLKLPTPHFLQLVHSLEKGVNSVSSRQSIVYAAQAVGHLCTFYHAQMQKMASVGGQQPGSQCGQNVQLLRTHFAADAGIFARVLQEIFRIILYDDAVNQWSMSRPMLPLILIDEQSFVLFRQHLISHVQQGERQQRLHEAFEKLMEGVDKNLEPRSRDKFTQNMTTFRHQTKMII